MTLPDRIQTVEALDEIMTRPRSPLIEFIPTLSSPLVILGAGGKMGPTLAVLARRAADEAGHPLDVIAVSRFSDGQSRQWLEARGVKTLLCDLFDPAALRRLPDADNVIYLVGLKFGTAQNPAATWATNTLLPAYAAERYAKARIAALSTGNVYPLSPLASGGLPESAALTPLGEYANSGVARERLFEFFSAKYGTPITLVRLSYALDLRYGVLVDIARKVFAGQPVDVTMGYFNAIWQGDANDLILRSLSLASCPPMTLNVTGTQMISVRDAALRFGELLQRPVEIVGAEADTALLSDTARLVETLGAPLTPLDLVMRWTADWIASGGPLFDKPTHFEVRDGAY
jgi:nucleoside-diphosphate-sugar epimerase